ncbi:MAG: hypothetical protein SO170_09005 [Butyribacter sp.]|nr:hypothetical protein [bacterium]MDY3855073.1 hypothetical protein [Butyribacter sp.]
MGQTAASAASVPLDNQEEPADGEKELKLSKQNVTITDDGYTIGDETVVYSGIYLITGTQGSSISFADATIKMNSESKIRLDLTEKNVRIDSGCVTLSGDASSYGFSIPENSQEITITLNNFINEFIERGYCNAIDIGANSKLNLILKDGTVNKLYGGPEASAIRVPESASLTIEGNGKLEAGINNGTCAAYCAVIGSQYMQNYGDITINGGELYIENPNPNMGTAIGTATWYSEETMTMVEGTSNGTITINGGEVHANKIGGAMTAEYSVLKGNGGIVYTDVLNADTTEYSGIIMETGQELEFSWTDSYECKMAYKEDGTIKEEKDCTITMSRDTENKKNIIYTASANFKNIVVTKQKNVTGVQCGEFLVIGNEENYTYSDGVLNIVGGTVYVWNVDEATPTSDRMMVSGNTTLILGGLNIVTSTGAPIEVDDNAGTDVTIKLSGENYLESGAVNKAAIHKGNVFTGGNNCSTLKITSFEGDGSFSGALKAISTNSAYWGAAGIGTGGDSAQTNVHGDFSNFEIAGGTIYAQGVNSGAGIGSCGAASVYNLVISGGKVTAKGRYCGIGTEKMGATNDISITGGIVDTHGYAGATPTGGIVSNDCGSNYSVYGENTLTQNFTIPEDGGLCVDDGARLCVKDGITLTNNGSMENYGSIEGKVQNNGVIHQNGTISPEPVGDGTICSGELEVVNGTGGGKYDEGTQVTISANAPESGKVFDKWVVKSGRLSLTSEQAANGEITFNMPKSCLIVEATYKTILAKVLLKDGTETQYTSMNEAMREWEESEGATLKICDDAAYLGYLMNCPKDGVIDLNGHAVSASRLRVYSDVTIQNGTLICDMDVYISSGTTVSFKDVTITSRDETSQLQIKNNGTIKDLGGLTLDSEVSVSYTVYNELQTLIEQTENISQGDYSDFSYGALKDVLENAKEITTDNSEAEIKAIITAINEAKEDLKESTIIVTLSSSPASKGTLVGGGKYAVGETVKLIAKDECTYKFNSWSLNDTVVSHENTYTFSVTEDMSGEILYVANYDQKGSHAFEGCPYQTDDTGKHYQICSVCGAESEHKECTPGDIEIENVIAPTCAESGSHDEVVCCTVCGQQLSKTTVTDEPTKEHNLVTTTAIRATATTNGKIETKCSVCGKVIDTTTIYAAKTIRLSATAYAYDGKVKKPTVIVKNSNGGDIDTSNYTVTYSGGRKNVGKYTVRISFKGNYAGTKSLTFAINPPKVSLVKLTAGKKGFTAKWAKKKTQTSGYELQYSTSKTFKKGNKTVRIASNKTTSKKIKKLKAKKTYYVRIRTYKTVKGAKLFSVWSAKKKIKTKK